MPSQNDQDRELIDAIDRLEKRIGDTAQATERTADRISDATDSVTKVVESSDRLGQAAFSAGRTGLMLGGAGLGLHQAYRSGALRAVALRAAGLGGFFGGGQQSAGSMGGLAAVARLASNLHPVLKAAGAALTVVGGLRMLGVGGGGGPSSGPMSQVAAESERQTQLLSQLVRESRVHNRNVMQTWARRQSLSDPFNRDPVRFMGGMFAPNEQQANRQAMLQVTNLQRQRAREAVGREFADMFVRERFAGNVAASGAMYVGQQYLGALNRARPMATTGLGGAGASFLMNRMLSSGILDAPGRGGALGGQAERDLFLAQTRGPGNISQPVMTATAGTASDYRMRVQLQRQELQREQTRQWQTRVLRAMEELVELGRIESDDYYRKRIEFNRPEGAV